MAFVISDRIKETSITTGNSTFTLNGAVTGFTTFAAVGNGNTCTYAIIAVDSNGVPTGEWETGIGTYTSSGTTLSRGVIKSSNSNSLVNFSAGTKHVICTDVAGYTTPLVMATTANRAIQVADQTALSSTAGNARGTGSVDLQIKRANATQVASGNYSCISGGKNNTSSGICSVISGGRGNNNNSMSYCVVVGGYNNKNYNDYSSICGGKTNQTWGAKSSILGGHNNYIASAGSVSIIGGGYGNRIYSAYSVICGGQLNKAQTNAYTAIVGGKSNSASGKYSFIGGGKSNVASGNRSIVVGGYINTASGTSSIVVGGINSTASQLYSTISGGTTQTCSGTYATICGGSHNTASGSKSIVLGGSYNTASATHSIAIGYYAKADKYGQLAASSGLLAALGDAQVSQFVLRKQTTNNTQAEMFLDNSSARMTLSNDTTWAFWGYLIARNTGTDSENACWKFDGQISRNTNAASTAVAGVTTTTINLDMGAAAWTITVDADTTNGSLRIRVTGENSKTINWVAVVHTVEVTG